MTLLHKMVLGYYFQICGPFLFFCEDLGEFLHCSDEVCQKQFLHEE